MKHSKLWAALVVGMLCGACAPGERSDEKAKERDTGVLIYGGTSAAVTAAVQLARMGKDVLVVCPDTHLGGLTSSGLGYTDTGNKEVIGGLAREFYQGIYRYYQRPDTWVWQEKEAYGNVGQGTPAIDGDARTMWIFEPHIAEQVFEDLIREAGVEVIRDAWLDRESGVEVEEGTIRSIRTLDGTTYRAAQFIDATYEGDLMAAAGVPYQVGREGNALYGETWNGVQTGVFHHGHNFGDLRVSPYVVPGEPDSGVLPRISTEPPGLKGEGDRRVQAYCFRTCLTAVPENRVPLGRPAGYDSTQYELILRVFDAGWNEVFQKFDPIPNAKTDVNNHGPFSFDNIGFSHDYPEASYERRREIVAEHTLYQQGLLYFLSNDPRVPDSIRTEMGRWGLAADEFRDNGNWPHQIYVREARRMVGDVVMTEHEILGGLPVDRSIGMGSYTMDSHNVQRYITPEGFVQNEGDLGVHPHEPYRIDLGTVMPRMSDCRNLLVPAAVSTSHIAFGSIRMEPVFMILGQSAATLAALALDADCAVQEVPYDALRTRLLADGQVLDIETHNL
ncbi:MAG: FAD-dependent oxidoreductase [Bacteroidales bacterium]